MNSSVEVLRDSPNPFHGTGAPTPPAPDDAGEGDETQLLAEAAQKLEALGAGDPETGDLVARVKAFLSAHGGGTEGAPPPMIGAG